MSSIPHKSSFSSYPLVALAASLAAGVLLARLASLSLVPSIASAVLAGASAVIAAFKKKNALASWLIALAFVCAGAVLASVAMRDGRSESRLRSFYERGVITPGEPSELTGVLERAPEIAPDGLVMSLRVESLRYKSDERVCAGRVELFAPVHDAREAAEYESLELRRGARVRVMAALSRAERYRDPGVSSLDEFLDARDLDARGTLKSPLLVERLDDERVLLPLFWLDEWRARLVRAADATFSRDTAGVLKAALLGNRYGLSRETAERFRDGGTFHVLVISGLHIGFIGGLVWWVARRLTRRRVLQWGAPVAVVWAYAVGVGASASVVRASLMFTLAALAPALGRRSSPLNALGGAALALLVWRPLGLFDASFQLTFVSVAGIAAVALPLLTNLKEVGEWRPTRATPYPPACPRWFQTLAEALYWRERLWKKELAHSTHSYSLFKTPWAARLERWRAQPLLRFAFTAALVSLVVQAALLPLLVLYFHRLSLASFALNIFVGATMVLFAFASASALALSHLSAALAAPLVRLSETLAALMIHSVDPFERAHVAALRLPEYTGAASAIYFFYFVSLLVVAAALLRWRPLGAPPRANVFGGARAAVDVEGVAPRSHLVKFACLALACAALVIVLHPLSAGRTGGRLRVDFLDVGQGDSALVTMPDGTTLLVDGGGRPELRQGRRDGEDDDAEEFEPDSRGVGDAVVSEYLWWRGLARVNYIVVTHADADHIDGLNAVAKNFKVDAALVARAPRDDAEFVRFASTARDAGLPVYVVGRGDSLRFGAVEADVLWPTLAEGDADSPSGNNQSLVLRLRFGQRTFLLTGDAESDAERALVAAGDDIRSDAVKVAHHGSRTSSTESFVSASRPAFAVVSVGQDSPYGHPHPEVVERWRAAGAQVLTTGQRGTITVSTDGEDLKVETFIKP
ncbi:MAG TPA: ComEC/Rec2 family competence protein [Pyrinomonadaceae bacterium]|nr:ComEC/Rec2 family competence protein [Pyrinomonadaceae bacterium]